MALKTEKYRKYYLKCSNTFLAGCILYGNFFKKSYVKVKAVINLWCLHFMVKIYMLRIKIAYSRLHKIPCVPLIKIVFTTTEKKKLILLMFYFIPLLKCRKITTFQQLKKIKRSFLSQSIVKKFLIMVRKLQ